MKIDYANIGLTSCCLWFRFSNACPYLFDSNLFYIHTTLHFACLCVFTILFSAIVPSGRDGHDARKQRLQIIPLRTQYGRRAHVHKVNASECKILLVIVCKFNSIWMRRLFWCKSVYNWLPIL